MKRLESTMKPNYPKTVLSLLLLLTAFFAQATPTATTASWETLWQGLFPATSQPEQQAICPSFPSCEDPPLAPAPTKPAGQKG